MYYIIDYITRHVYSQMSQIVGVISCQWSGGTKAVDRSSQLDVAELPTYSEDFLATTTTGGEMAFCSWLRNSDRPVAISAC